jgi:hypothetical protein
VEEDLVPVEGLEPPTHGLQNSATPKTARDKTGHTGQRKRQRFLALAQIAR